MRRLLALALLLPGIAFAACEAQPGDKVTLRGIPVGASVTNYLRASDLNYLLHHGEGVVNAKHCATLQQAIDATPTGGTLVIPQGEYTFADTLTIARPMTVAGLSASTYPNGNDVRLHYTGTGAAISISAGSGSSTFIYRVHLKDLTILADGGASAGVYGHNVQESSFEGVQVAGSLANPMTVGFDFDGLSISNLDRLIVQYAVTGIYCRWMPGGQATGAVNLTRSNIYWTTTGLRLGSIDYLNVTDNWFEVFTTAILADNGTDAGGLLVDHFNVTRNQFVQSQDRTEARCLLVRSSDDTKQLQFQASFDRNTCYMRGANPLATSTSYAVELLTAGHEAGNYLNPLKVNLSLGTNWYQGVATAGVHGDDADQTIYLDGRNEALDIWYGNPMAVAYGPAVFYYPLRTDRSGLTQHPEGGDLIFRNASGAGKGIYFRESTDFNAMIIKDGSPIEFNRTLTAGGDFVVKNSAGAGQGIYLRESSDWNTVIIKDGVPVEFNRAIDAKVGVILPTSSVGLPSGAIWNNGGVIAIVP